MNSKERVRCSLEHCTPDKVPVFADYVPEIKYLLKEKYQVPEEEIGILLGNDIVSATIGIDASYYASDDDEYTCKWGIRWKNVYNSAGHYTEIVDHPLAGSMDKLNDYKIPDPDESTQYKTLENLLEKHGESKWIVGSSLCSIF